ncbi:VanZ family protein [Clostridium boliviensis]|nr:VanZ family protein [Clostridium boliviensis]
MVIVLLMILKSLFYYLKKWTFMSTYQIVAVGTFISYIYIVLMISYFSRPAGSRNDVNLIFLETWRNSAQSRAYVVENIIMMIPFGLLLPAFFKPSRNFFCCIPLGFMFSVCLEYSQFLSKRGYMQTDDVVMNVIGTSIGYVVFLLLDFIIRPLQKNARI